MNKVKKAAGVLIIVLSLVVGRMVYFGIDGIVVNSTGESIANHVVDFLEWK